MNIIQNNLHEYLKASNKIVDTGQDTTIGNIITDVNALILAIQQDVSAFETLINNEQIVQDGRLTTNETNIGTNVTNIAQAITDYEASDVLINTRITSEIATVTLNYGTLTSDLATLRTDFDAGLLLVNNIVTQNKTELDDEDIVNANAIALVRTDFEAADILLDGRIDNYEYDLLHQSKLRLDSFLSQVNVTGIIYNADNNIDSISYEAVERDHILNRIFKETYTYNGDKLITAIAYTETSNSNALVATASFTYDAQKRLFTSAWVNA